MNKLLALLIFGVCLCVSVYSQGSKPTPSSGSGMGNGIGRGNSQSSIPNSNSAAQPLRILSKARANYTDEARKKGDEGVVRVRVVFLASGKIGLVTPISGLPNGLTEQAILAAKQIQFIPQTLNGQPVNVTKIVEYSFSIYYKENDKDLERNAEILEMPNVEYPQEENLKKHFGKVKILLVFTNSDKVQIITVESDLPREFKQKAVEAALKIKFKPAVHKNGKEVSQTKEIEYEFKPQNK